MRIQPVHPDQMDPEVRYVHDEVYKLITKSQGPVSMITEQGSLTGPFPPMLRFPQFGIPALSFIRSLDTHAKLPKKVRETVILTVGSAYGARFELYAHEIMAGHVGFSPPEVASLAMGHRPTGLNEEERLAYELTHSLVHGKILPASAYSIGIKTFGDAGMAELIFLTGAYSLIATVLNGFDVPAPEPGA